MYLKMLPHKPFDIAQHVRKSVQVSLNKMFLLAFQCVVYAHIEGKPKKCIQVYR